MSKVVAVLGALALVAFIGVVSFYQGQVDGYENVNGNIRANMKFMDTHEMMFKEWMKQYQVNYANWAEYQERFRTWLKHWEVVEKHNSEPNTFTLEMNQFADMENTDFRRYWVGFRPSDNSNAEIVELSTDNLPDTMDWTTQGAVTGVKNQGSCGSCWAFSTTGALEGLNYLTNGKLVSLSEQQLVDCAGGSYGNEGCNGGEMESAFQYVADHGIESEADYSYTGRDGTCKFASSKSVFKNTSYKKVTPKKSSQLKAAVAQQPVSVGVDGGSLGFQLYGKGVISALCGTKLDHGVLAVGYGTHKTLFSGDVDVWKVKNSWGSGWGNGGYCYVKRTDDDGSGTCGIAIDPSYPTA